MSRIAAIYQLSKYQHASWICSLYFICFCCYLNKINIQYLRKFNQINPTWKPIMYQLLQWPAKDNYKNDDYLWIKLPLISTPGYAGVILVSNCPLLAMRIAVPSLDKKAEGQLALKIGKFLYLLFHFLCLLQNGYCNQLNVKFVLYYSFNSYSLFSWSYPSRKFTLGTDQS